MITTIGLILAVILVALVIYLVPNMDAFLKKILIGIVVVLAIFWLLGMFGFHAGLIQLWR